MLDGLLRVLVAIGGVVLLLAGVGFAIFGLLWICLLAARYVPLTGQWRKRWRRSRDPGPER